MNERGPARSKYYNLVVPDEVEAPLEKEERLFDFVSHWETSVKLTGD
jgi:hypothetical protein